MIWFHNWLCVFIPFQKVLKFLSLPSSIVELIFDINIHLADIGPTTVEFLFYQFTKAGTEKADFLIWNYEKKTIQQRTNTKTLNYLDKIVV